MRNRWFKMMGLTAVLTGAGLGLAVEGSFGTPPRVLPYGGALDLNGSPVSGNVPMTFFILDSPTAPLNNALWSEDYPVSNPVAVAGGRFTVELGSLSPPTGIPDAVLRHGELYVAVRVAGVDLAGRQRLLSNPFAITAAQAQDFHVTGNLQVDGTLNVAPGALVDGTITSGDIANLAVQSNHLAANAVQSSHLAPTALVVEAESVPVNSYTGPTTVVLGVASRRFCFVSQWSDEGPDNCFRGCTVEVAGGSWQLRATGSSCAGGIGQATCHARCVAW